MTMMRNNFLIFILGIFTLPASAQVAGYLGKRLSIGYSNYLSPSLLFPSARSSEDGTLGINSTHCANVEYAIKRRTVFCFSTQYGKTGLEKRSFDYLDPNNVYYGSSSGDYHPSNKRPLQLRTLNFSLGFKFFGYGYIAPVGKYKKLELLVLNCKVTYDRNAFYSGPAVPANRINVAIGTGEYTYNSVGLAFTIGRQRMLNDVIILDTGIRFGVVANPVLSVLLGEFFDSGSSYYNGYYVTSMEDQIRPEVHMRLFGQQLVNFHIGIGFLAF